MTTTTQTLIPAGTWQADPGHSRVGFSVKHMGIATVRGYFADFEASLALGDDLDSAEITASIQAASVDTNEPARDEHLRSPDFFDAENHPQLSFRSTKVEQSGDDTITVTGELQIRGITQEIVLEGEINGLDEDPWGNQRLGVELTGSLSRADYEMKFNQALGSGNMLVGDKVKLTIDISAVQQ